MALLALATAVFAWAGAAAGGAGVSLPRLLGAGANCLPASLLFLGLGALAFGVLPRWSAGIAYGLVSLAFVWELFGALLGAPGWTLGLSPFHHIGLVPSQPFRAVAAVLMLAIGGAAAVLGATAFRRRDLAAG
jgi:ABC-2 type transport system permease protein